MSSAHGEPIMGARPVRSATPVPATNKVRRPKNKEALSYAFSINGIGVQSMASPERRLLFDLTSFQIWILNSTNTSTDNGRDRKQWAPPQDGNR